jgi:hypothetical protein
MRATIKSIPRLSFLVAILAMAAIMATFAPAGAASQREATTAHTASKGITERRARRVIRRNAETQCHAVESKKPVTVYFPAPDIPAITKMVSNGKCLSASVPYDSCDPGVWTAGGDGVDMFMAGHDYFVCTMQIKWQTTKYTWHGVCWVEVGSPKDNNVMITAIRAMEVGYDGRGALRTHVDPWKCRSS